MFNSKLTLAFVLEKDGKVGSWCINFPLEENEKLEYDQESPTYLELQISTKNTLVFKINIGTDTLVVYFLKSQCRIVKRTTLFFVRVGFWNFLDLV